MYILKNIVFSQGSKLNQVLCAFLINIPALSYGMAMGWMSPMSLLLQSKHSPTGIPLTDLEVSWMAAIGYLTCIPATFLVAYLADIIGRKITLLLGSVIGAIIWIIHLSSLQVWAMILARVLVGVIMAGCYVTCTVYTKEISEDSIRGALGCIVSLLIAMGNLILYIMGDLLDYHTINWICLAVPLFHLVVFVFMPESPSYLVEKGKFKEATMVLAWLRCRREDDDMIQVEIDQIKKEQDVHKVGKRSVFKNIFSNDTLLSAFSIAIIVTLARDVCGAVTVLNFAGDIFLEASKDSQFSLNANQQAIVVGVVQVAGAMLASTVVERAGRKLLLIVTSIFAGLTICILALWFHFGEYGIIGPSWIPIVSLCLTIFSDSAGLKPVALVVSNEIFSFEYRGTVMAIATAIASVTDFLQLLFFKPLAKLIGIYTGFYFFGAVCIFTALYVFIFVPETKARSMDEIYEDLKTKRKIKCCGTSDF